jgi:hypothetical protein
MKSFEIELIEIPEYGDHITIDDYINSVQLKVYTSDDGHGYYATDKGMSYIVTHFWINCIKIMKYQCKFTHVVWFNK